MELLEEHLKILKALANVAPEGLTPHSLSDACLLTHGLVRDLLAELEDAHYVEVSGSGMTAVVAITRSGELALTASFQASTSINVHGTAVQVGNHNIQDFGFGEEEDEDEEEDEEEDEDEDDEDEDDEADYADDDEEE
jgi:phosphopantothenoylcysteine synthetase/decarboxylase